MRLDIETVQIKEIQEGPETLARDGVLYLNLKELQKEILLTVDSPRWISIWFIPEMRSGS